LKSKFSGNETDEEWRLANMLEGHKKRLRQAQVVAELVEERFSDNLETALFAVVGDFNDTPFSPWVAPLVNSRTWWMWCAIFVSLKTSGLFTGAARAGCRRLTIF
jgi:hypothetical protein